ncbi:hypothetical protein L5515_004657 [Caenorhabditis briggsae]|uniref:Protein kinase domain-containing protein n=2 Tax=Caenorhabditis briggsae TaxID=6238 RepID=A0AAE9EN69_CAEBR|nr:hypothetical protein L3Y34_001815 [Caenorhabditis briggsae]UMM24407.1 hypothetical protein L5515_004657 [Caenorhabditis briggsae]
MTQIDQAFRDLEYNPTADALGTFTTQLETLSKMLPFPDMKAGLMDCLRKIRRDRRFDAVRNDETMLRLYKILGQYSENLGMKGIYLQLHTTGNFSKSLNLYLQWAEELAKKQDLTEFTKVLDMARKALDKTLTMPEIESGFRDMADEYFPDGRAAALFASPDDTLDVFRDNAPGRRMKRRSSVCHLQQVAPVNTAKEAAFGPRTKTKLRSEFIDVPGTFGVSIEEFRYAKWKDTFGEDVDPHRRDSGIVQAKHQVAANDRCAREEVENRIASNLKRRPPLSPLSEANADDEDEKRSRIYSPLVPTKDATRPALRNSKTFQDNIPTITLSSDTKSASSKEISYNQLDDSDTEEKLKTMAAGREKARTSSLSSSTSSSTRTAKSGGLDLMAENNCLEAHAMFSETVHIGGPEKTMVISDETMSIKPTEVSSNFSVLCDPDPTMNLTHDRPKKTSGGLNMVFDELALVEESIGEAVEVKTVSKIKKDLEDTRLGKSLRTPPTLGDEDDMFDDELIHGHGFGKITHGSIVTSTPAAGVAFVDIESYFGNKSEADREEEENVVQPKFVVPTGSTFNKLMRRKSQAAAAQAQVAPPAPPPPAPKQVPAANSSIDCLSDNLGRRLSLGADEIRAAIVAGEAETTGILNRRRSEIIRKGDINPWDETLRRRLMATVRAPINMHEFQERAPKIQANRDCEVGGEVFHIQTLIGQGGYAKVYKAVNEEKKVVAVKYEVPSCSWEVYICDQMRNRLIKDREDRVKMADWCIMKVMDAYVFSTASLLVNEYHEYGTLLEYANSMKDPNWHISCFLLTQMARILKEVHACNIIHGDIKPDNFMITRKIDPNWDKDALMSNDTFVVKIIDWGRAIDMMQLKDQTFKGRAGTEDFDSPEMIDGRPWNYQADYFGFAATMAVVVTAKYGKLTGSKVGEYSLSCDIKRRNALRNTIFDIIKKFLNIESVNTLPDWSEAIQQFADFWETNFDGSSWRQAIAKFNEVCDLAATNHKQ